MAVTVEEKPDSREITTGDNASAVLRYSIRGTADDGEAKAALGSEAPSTYDGLVRKSREVTPVFVDVSSPDKSIWEGVARYGRRVSQPETGESVYSFDTGGGTQHVTQSRETAHKYGAGGAAPTDFGGAIGVTGQGQDLSVQGIDVTVPMFNWTETHYLAGVYVTTGYKKALRDLTGTINSAGFRGFAAGEVLFRGARGSMRSGSDWEITFNFSSSLNRYGMQVGGITGIEKGAWDYLWVRYVRGVSEGKQLPQPTAVYVERVYPRGDFYGLGIGA